MYTYLIKNPKTKAIKIGKSNNYEKRLAQAQTYCDTKLSILAVFKADDFSEKYLHDLFSLYRLKGEWFSYRDAGKKAFDDFLLDHKDKCIPIEDDWFVNTSVDFFHFVIKNKEFHLWMRVYFYLAGSCKFDSDLVSTSIVAEMVEFFATDPRNIRSIIARLIKDKLVLKYPLGCKRAKGYIINPENMWFGTDKTRREKLAIYRPFLKSQSHTQKDNSQFCKDLTKSSS